MLTIAIEQEADGRWIADVTSVPGTLAFEATNAEAHARAAALACRVIADPIEHGDPIPDAAPLP